MMKYNWRAELDKHQRDMMQSMLDKCREDQREFFWKIFKNGVPASKLNDAIDLIERTIVKNEKKSSSEA